jgi:hypothetical protein
MPRESTLDFFGYLARPVLVNVNAQHMCGTRLRQRMAGLSSHPESSSEDHIVASIETKFLQIIGNR